MFCHIQVVASFVGVLPLLVSLMSIWMPSTQALTTSDPLRQGYDVEEFITEVITEVVFISTTEQTSEEDKKDIYVRPDYPGESFLVFQFTITNRRIADVDKLKAEILYEVTSLCKRFDDFLRVILLSLYNSGSVITEVALEFTRKLDIRERNAVLQTFYEAVELNNTLGSLKVNTLYTMNEPGSYKRIEDACDIVHCIHDKMNCVSKGLECISTCELNPTYCQNNSTCLNSRPETHFIRCSCAEGYSGYQCETPRTPRNRPYSENVFVGIISAVSVALFCLILLFAFILCSRIKKAKSEYRSDIYPVENVIALEMSTDYFIVGGVGCQTDDSFLLTQYMLNGTPPKPGFSHSVMQTTDSFLLAKSQGRPYVKKAQTSPAPSAPTPIKSNGTTNNEVLTDAPEKRLIPSEKEPEPEGGLDNNGAINEGFMKDEDIEPTQPVAGLEEDIKDPQRIVKV